MCWNLKIQSQQEVPPGVLQMSEAHMRDPQEKGPELGGFKNLLWIKKPTPRSQTPFLCMDSLRALSHGARNLKPQAPCLPWKLFAFKQTLRMLGRQLQPVLLSWWRSICALRGFLNKLCPLMGLPTFKSRAKAIWGQWGFGSGSRLRCLLT